MNQRKFCSLGGSTATNFLHLVCLFWFCLFFCCFATLAWADDTQTNKAPANLGDLSLEALMQIEVPVVTGASKLEQKTPAAPASVTIIGADDIKKYGDRTLADVLASVPGFNVSYDRNYAFLG